MKFYALDDPRGQYDWLSVYFHRQMEDYVDLILRRTDEDDRWAPDLVSGDTPMESVPDGEHECSVYGLPGLLFLWTREQQAFRKGLICHPSDEAAVKQARQAADERRPFI